MTGKGRSQNKSKREEEARSRGFVGADRESWVDAALTRASRRLQKKATAAPLALSLDRERDPNRSGWHTHYKSLALLAARTSRFSVILEENAGSGTLCEGDKSPFA